MNIEAIIPDELFERHADKVIVRVYSGLGAEEPQLLKEEVFYREGVSPVPLVCYPGWRLVRPGEEPHWSAMWWSVSGNCWTPRRHPLSPYVNDTRYQVPIVRPPEMEELWEYIHSTGGDSKEGDQYWSQSEAEWIDLPAGEVFSKNLLYRRPTGFTQELAIKYWPEWFKGEAIAMDRDGEWRGHEKAPVITTERGIWLNGGGKEVSFGLTTFDPPPVTNWQLSLMKNPHMGEQ